MRILRPAGAPSWLEAVLVSIEKGLRHIWDLPFRLWRVETADLPPAADHMGGWVYDLTANVPKYSDGSNWLTFSLSSHVHAASAVTFVPAGGVAATDVQAAIEELDTEKLNSADYTAADILNKLLTVDGSGSFLDADRLDGQTGTFFLSRANHTGTQLASTISDFSEAVDDRVGTLLTAGANIELTYSDVADTLTIAVTGLAPIATSGSASDLSAGTVPAARMPALTGDATTVAGAVATTLATVNANVGSFGSATQVATFTVNAKGLTTAAANVTITPAASSITGGAALTRTNDTNVTLTLGGAPTTALLAATSLTLGWTGTLAATRGGTGVSALGNITKADDTNVTLTLGGTPTGAVINSTSFTLGWTGTLSVARGGTGRATSTTAYALLAAGTTATGAHQTLAAGATTEILVGGGASALPVWTTATGTGAPVRAGSPAFTGTATFAALSSSGNAALGDATGDSHTITGSLLLNSGPSSGLLGQVSGVSTWALFGSSSTLSVYADNTIVRAFGGTVYTTFSSTGADIVGEARCDTLRIDATPTAAAVAQTHHVPININGTVYKLLLAS